MGQIVHVANVTGLDLQLAVRDAVRSVLRRPGTLLLFTLIALLGLAGIGAAIWFAQPLFAALTVAAVILALFVRLVVRHRIVRDTLENFPPRSSVTTTVDDEGLQIAVPGKLHGYAWDDLTSIAITRNVALLHSRKTRRTVLMPRRLLTDAGLDRMLAGLSGVRLTADEAHATVDRSDGTDTMVADRPQRARQEPVDATGGS